VTTGVRPTTVALVAASAAGTLVGLILLLDVVYLEPFGDRSQPEVALWTWSALVLAGVTVLVWRTWRNIALTAGLVVLAAGAVSMIAYRVLWPIDCSVPAKACPEVEPLCRRASCGNGFFVSLGTPEMAERRATVTGAGVGTVFAPIGLICLVRASKRPAAP
jgi:hypothetical protein